MHLSFRAGDIVRALVVSFILAWPLILFVIDYDIYIHLEHFPEDKNNLQ